MSRWIVEPTGTQDPALMAQWDALNARLFGAHPLLSARFAMTLLDSFGSGRERLCWLPAADGSMAAALWLQPQAHGYWSTFLPLPAQLGLALVSDACCLESLVHALRAYAIDVLCQDSALLKLDTVNPWLSEINKHVSTTAIPLQGDFAAYWEGRPSKLRQNMRRYQRKTEASGVVARVDCLSSPADVQAALRRYGELEQRGWKGRLGTAVSPSHRQYAFFERLLDESAQLGQALVYELWFDEQLAASRLVLVGGERVIFMKTTYDESLGELAPGRQLLCSVIEDLFLRHPGKMLEFYTNADTDLLMWAVQSRPILHVRNYRNRSVKTMVGGYRQLRALLHQKKEAPPSNRQGALEGESQLPPDHDVVVDCYLHPREFPPDVAQLMAQAEARALESGGRWFELLVDHALPGGERAMFYVLRRGERAMAILPLVLVPEGRWSLGRQRLESLSNFYTSLYEPIVREGMRVRAGDLAHLLRAVRKRHRQVSRWQFGPLDPNAQTYTLLVDALQAAGFVTFPYFRFGNHFMAGRPWSAYWGGHRLRITIDRMRRRLIEAGGRVEIVGVGDTSVEAGIAAYERIYASSWKVPEPFPQFVPGLIRLAATAGWLRLGVAWMGAEPIAAQIWLVNGGRAAIFKMAYDGAYKKHSAGSILSSVLMQHVLEIDQVHEVDYLIGDDPYKRDWMDQRRERWGLLAFDPFGWRGLLGLGIELGTRGARQLQRFAQRQFAPKKSEDSKQ